MRSRPGSGGASCRPACAIAAGAATIWRNYFAPVGDGEGQTATLQLDALERVGEALSGLLGGLPITSVIVRSSANIYAGARTRLSAFVHGLVMLAAVALLASILNRIPLAALASILLVVGYKLASHQIVMEMLTMVL